MSWSFEDEQQLVMSQQLQIEWIQACSSVYFPRAPAEPKSQSEIGHARTAFLSHAK